MLITVEHLDKMGVCPKARFAFTGAFHNGIELTLENFELAYRQGLQTAIFFDLVATWGERQENFSLKKNSQELSRLIWQADGSNVFPLYADFQGQAEHIAHYFPLMLKVALPILEAMTKEIEEEKF